VQCKTELCSAQFAADMAGNERLLVGVSTNSIDGVVGYLFASLFGLVLVCCIAVAVLSFAIWKTALHHPKYLFLFLGIFLFTSFRIAHLVRFVAPISSVAPFLNGFQFPKGDGDGWCRAVCFREYARAQRGQSIGNALLRVRNF
jgi:hypothetical protein